MNSALRYRISGNDLWCPDAKRRKVWMEYCPQPAQIFFTHHNRDPKIYPDGYTLSRNSLYNMYKLVGVYYSEHEVSQTDNPKELGLYEYDINNFVLTEDTVPVEDKIYYNPGVNVDVSDTENVSEQLIAKTQKWYLVHRNTAARIPDNDISSILVRGYEPGSGKWELKYITCDFPYIFCSYQNNITDEWHSGFFNKQLEWTDYNPFEWTGRNSNVEYVYCKYNDKTGLGVVVKDWNDLNETLLNIDKLPEIENSVIHVDNYFEYKAADGTVEKFTVGYWFNRFATDFNYEPVLVCSDLPLDPDDGDVILYNGVLKRYDTLSNEWADVDMNTVKEVAQKEVSPIYKELGWTPDTKLVYPAPEVYRYLVARLAEKFAALNESNIMGVQSELADARFAFQAFLKKDKSAWERIRNVNPATIGDWL